MLRHSSAWYREKKTRELFGFMRFVHARDLELLPFTSASNGSELKVTEIVCTCSFERGAVIGALSIRAVL